jgi:hypothetical protein
VKVVAKNFTRYYFEMMHSTCPLTMAPSTSGIEFPARPAVPLLQKPLRDEEYAKSRFRVSVRTSRWLSDDSKGGPRSEHRWDCTAWHRL